MAFTFCGPAFQQVHLASGLVTLLTRSYNPPVQALRFGLFRFRSPLLSESRLIYFPPGTEMVHFPGLTRTRLCIQQAVIEVHSIGFPHSDIPGSKRICRSPRLIAACHVLRRLLAPRHPPYALSSLTIKLTQHVSIPRGTKSLSCRRRTLLQSFVVFSSVLRVKASSPFHNTLLEQIMRFTPSTPRGETSACRAEGVNCQLPSVVKEPSYRQSCTEPLRAWRSVKPVWSRSYGK